MRHLLLALAVLSLGCIGAQENGPAAEATTTTQAISTTTTTTSTTVTSTTETTLPPALPPEECAAQNASFWRALCLDGAAYAQGDARLCGTVFCAARFEGPGLCGNITLNSTDWVAYKRNACVAWAQRQPYLCDESLRSGECIRWYALLDNDPELCESTAHNILVDCPGDFAYWRGNMSACNARRTLAVRSECQNRYWEMVAVDNMNASLCAPIKLPHAENACMVRAGYSGPPEKHPLYGLRTQIISGPSEGG
jgi:hypothetical protein